MQQQRQSPLRPEHYQTPDSSSSSTNRQADRGEIAATRTLFHPAPKRMRAMTASSRRARTSTSVLSESWNSDGACVAAQSYLYALLLLLFLLLLLLLLSSMLSTMIVRVIRELHSAHQLGSSTALKAETCAAPLLRALQATREATSSNLRTRSSRAHSPLRSKHSHNTVSTSNCE